MRNMVSKILKNTALIIVAVFTFLSCDKPFVLDLPLAVDSHEYDISVKAGTARIFFYTNRAWTISFEPADCSWATVNKKSGDGKADVEEILLTYQKSTCYNRQVTLVITAGNLQERITIYQQGSASTSVDDLETIPLTPLQ